MSRAWKKDLTEEIRLFKLGVPMATLAKKLGITRQALRDAFVRRGIIAEKPE